MISIYCDGSSNGRSNSPTGWAWIIVRGDDIVCAGSAGDREGGTNNTAELRAALDGMRDYLKIRDSLLEPLESVEVVSDSMYMLDLASGKSKANKNTELARELRSLALEIGATCRWVRGHGNCIYNIKCDELARHQKDLHTPNKTLKSREKKKLAKKAARKERKIQIKNYKKEVSA